MEMESGFGLPSARDPMSWLKVKFPKHVTQIVTDVDMVTGVAPTSSTSSDLGNTDYPWSLQFIHGRGYCAFANRKFMAGELIMTESPTVWATGHHPFNDNQIREIDEKVSLLPLEDREAFLDMANVFPESSGAAAGIFMTNSFDMVDSPRGLSCGMYVALARLNHSCTPNAQQTHIPSSGEEVLYASRDIQIGEEICDCYIDLRQDRASRRKELLEGFRFHCNCSACVRGSSLRNIGTSACVKGNSVAMSQSDGNVNGIYYNSSSILECEGPGIPRTNILSPGDTREVEKRDDSHIKVCDDISSVDENHFSVETDDRDRLFAADFEDQSIELVIKGDLPAAFELLLEGLSVLEKKNNLLWSVRYLSGVHLNVYQVLLQLIECEGDNNDSIGRGKRSRNSKPRKRDKLATMYYSKMMEQQLRFAHDLNLKLQGPLCPESVNTQNLMEEHNL